MARPRRLDSPAQQAGRRWGDAGSYEKDEIGRLREEVKMLRQQLDNATFRLDALEK